MKNGVFNKLIEFLILLVFAFSAYTKVIDMRAFEIAIHGQMSIPWDFMELVSRLILISEILIVSGLLYSLITNFVEARIFTIGVLGVMTLYLLINLVLEGNKENCGCFSELVQMDTYSSIGKNIIMIFLLGLTFRKQSRNHNPLSLKKKLLFSALTIVVVITVFVVYPISTINTTTYIPNKALFIEESNLSVLEKEVKEDVLANYSMVIVAKPLCRHCKAFVKDLNKLAVHDSSYSRVLILMASRTEENIQSFQSITNNKFNWVSVPNESIGKLCDGIFPVFYYVKGNQVFGPLLSTEFRSKDYKGILVN
ncbi:MAG: MauE/DoxX family redox-associated membrane protein [Salibacteraceae bacterium]